MTGAAPTRSRPALRWYGGKWRLAPQIVRYFPPHKAYCEPYGGAASVLLTKPPAPLETYNDKYERVVNFFRVLRERPGELVRLIEATPYARAEYDAAYQPHPDPLEDARRFYVLAWQGRIGGASSSRRATGWRYLRDPTARSAPPDDFAATWHLWQIAERFRHVQIECDDALTVICRYDTHQTLHYVDPPYAPGTCDNQGRYEYGMTEQDHRALADVLHRARGMVVLSGYDSPLYRELYAGWEHVQLSALTDASRPAVECLWFNPAATYARHGQLRLTEATP